MNKTAINYVEFPAKDLAATKLFFEKTFGWAFKDYAPEYTAFGESGLDGGFYKSELCASTETGSALIVLYTNQLEKTLDVVSQKGAVINKPIFSFPDGRRFHFIEPSGNELAVWSDQ